MKYSGLALLAIFSLNCFAEQLTVDYASFYSHVRKIDKQETDKLQFGFGFQNIHEDRLCVIDSAFISTQKQKIELQVTEENRFTVPSDKVLKLAKAKVIVELQEAANICDISVQLETKSEYLMQSYSQQGLAEIFSQYQTFFDDIGGFLSFMMPDATGLTFHFKGNVKDIYKGKSVTATTDNTLSVDEKWLNKNQGLEFTNSPYRITATTSK
jgi:hypothetical protein